MEENHQCTHRSTVLISRTDSETLQYRGYTHQALLSEKKSRQVFKFFQTQCQKQNLTPRVGFNNYLEEQYIIIASGNTRNNFWSYHYCESTRVILGKHKGYPEPCTDKCEVTRSRIISSLLLALKF